MVGWVSGLGRYDVTLELGGRIKYLCVVIVDEKRLQAMTDSEAHAAYERALSLAQSEPARRFLSTRRKEMADTAS
jgi:predicted RNA polymerase sigma factor